MLFLVQWQQTGFFILINCNLLLHALVFLLPLKMFPKLPSNHNYSFPRSIIFEVEYRLYYPYKFAYTTKKSFFIMLTSVSVIQTTCLEKKLFSSHVCLFVCYCISYFCIYTLFNFSRKK
jgi:hypothetical protein